MSATGSQYLWMTISLRKEKLGGNKYEKASLFKGLLLSELRQTTPSSLHPSGLAMSVSRS